MIKTNRQLLDRSSEIPVMNMDLLIANETPQNLPSAKNSKPAVEVCSIEDMSITNNWL